MFPQSNLHPIVFEEVYIRDMKIKDTKPDEVMVRE